MCHQGLVHLVILIGAMVDPLPELSGNSSLDCCGTWMEHFPGAHGTGNVLASSWLNLTSTLFFCLYSLVFPSCVACILPWSSFSEPAAFPPVSLFLTAPEDSLKKCQNYYSCSIFKAQSALELFLECLCSSRETDWSLRLTAVCLPEWWGGVCVCVFGDFWRNWLNHTKFNVRFKGVMWVYQAKDLNIMMNDVEPTCLRISDGDRQMTSSICWWLYNVFVL